MSGMDEEGQACWMILIKQRRFTSGKTRTFALASLTAIFMKKQGRIFCLLAISMALLTACTEQPAPTLAYKEREVVDSLFRQQVDSLKPLFDKRCASQFDSAVQFKTDSMLTVRTAQIQKALERLRQESNQ